MPLLVSLFQSAAGAFLKGTILTVLSTISTFLGSRAIEMCLDAIDESVAYLLENQEEKAKQTPSKADDRRLAIYRKYFSEWQNTRKKKVS